MRTSCTSSWDKGSHIGLLELLTGLEEVSSRSSSASARFILAQSEMIAGRHAHPFTLLFECSILLQANFLCPVLTSQSIVDIIYQLVWPCTRFRIFYVVRPGKEVSLGTRLDSGLPLGQSHQPLCSQGTLIGSEQNDNINRVIRKQLWNGGVMLWRNHLLLTG
jgi:hypothetical protein